MNFFKPSSNSSESKNKFFFIVLEVVFIIALLVIWISSESIRHNKSLWILFLYSMPSEFIIPLVPHEPVILYFGKYYHPLTVSLVAIAGTVITEMLNYSLFTYVTEIKSLEKIKKNKFTTKLVDLFNKAPFTALIIAGFTPVPFHPFRFLVVFADYPLIKYSLAVFISRTPRFFILALLGHEIHLTTWMLIVIFIIFLILSYLSVLGKQIKK